MARKFNSRYTKLQLPSSCACKRRLTEVIVDVGDSAELGKTSETAQLSALHFVKVQSSCLRGYDLLYECLEKVTVLFAPLSGQDASQPLN